MAEQSWTDTITAIPLVRRRSVHFTELQDAINSYEANYDIGTTSWSDSPATDVKINYTVITEMQDALDALYQLANSTDFSWTERPHGISPFGTAPASRIRAVHVNEAREAMNLLQDSFCIGCDTCDDFGCTCDSSCNIDPCDQCDSSCYSADDKGACNLCNKTCNVDVCSQCDAGCYNETCSQCDVVNHRYPWS